MLTLSRTKRIAAGRKDQGGAALVLVTIGMLAMLAVAGLALDASHSIANNTRLQSTVDAAALAAAKAYDQVPDIGNANTAALAVFGINADGAGNQEMNTAYDASSIDIDIQWSETLVPFVNSGVGPYVRVIATGFDVQVSLSAVLGLNDIGVAASAVAGPSPSINTACNLAPLVACALDPDDSNLFGFEPNRLEVLKSGGGDSSDIGPGNFQLIRLGCPGGDCVRENLAGGYDGCLENGETVDTEPGNTVGPSVQGLNTRFGDYRGAMSPDEYPPDVITTAPSPALTYDSDTDTVQQGTTTATEATVDYVWDDYTADIAANALTNHPPVGVYERRVLTISIARCDGSSGGQTQLDVVGFGCYFMLQPAVQKGTEAQIFGQFLEGCQLNGAPGPDPRSGPNPYIIQLYKDPDSGDS